MAGTSDAVSATDQSDSLDDVLWIIEVLRPWSPTSILALRQGFEDQPYDAVLAFLKSLPLVLSQAPRGLR